MEPKERAEELREKLDYYSKLYYDEDNSPLSDYDYDMMMNELKKIEKEHPELITKDSPTQHVGGHVRESYSWGST